jgi:hypothetical protein
MKALFNDEKIELAEHIADCSVCAQAFNDRVERLSKKKAPKALGKTIIDINLSRQKSFDKRAFAVSLAIGTIVTLLLIWFIPLDDGLLIKRMTLRLNLIGSYLNSCIDSFGIFIINFIKNIKVR